MGGIKDTLFGKPATGASGNSYNQAYGPIMSAFSPAFGYTTMGGNAMASLLGLGGGGGSGGTPGQTVDMWHDGIDGNAAAAEKAGQPTSYTIAGAPGTAGSGGMSSQTDALENFANSGGMNFLREQGNKQITSNKAASGLMKSGSFGTALEKYGQGLASTYLNQYMDNLFKLSQIGLGAGSLATDAGRVSTQTGGKPGKGGLLPSLVGSLNIGDEGIGSGGS